MKQQKKKIAVCGNGWNNEFLKTVLPGIRKCAAENHADVFLLMNYSGTGGDEYYKDIGAANIFRLLEHGQFDGVIVLANTFHWQEEYDYVTTFINQHQIPAISLEYEIPGIDFWGSDNYSGMYELCTHLIECHNVKNVLFVSGPKGNPENDSRRKALEDVLLQHNLSLPEENVLCCNWNYFEVLDKLPLWLDEQEHLPDAVVCANDVMAMAACTVLKERGFLVPEKVKVTGFDHLFSARTFCPMITSVDRNWEDMGYQGMQSIIDKINGKSQAVSMHLKSRYFRGESCGCKLHKADIAEQRYANQGDYDRLVNSSFWEGHLCDIAECLSDLSSEKELHICFGNYLQKEHKYEGEELYICLADNFFSSLFTDDILKLWGYTQKVDVICSIKNGVAQERKRIDTRCLIPDYDAEGEGGKIYVFLPLFSIQGCYGYVAFGNDVPMMYNYSLNSWMRTVRQALGRIRQNILLKDMNQQLEKLSVTDGLTGVYNRMGCEKVAYPYLEQCHKQGKKAVLMFADINKMKVINDKYGHLQGDNAICTVATVIKEVLKEKWIIVRYGGDEFLMVGECADENQPVRLLRDISNHLEKTAVNMQLPYQLKVGVGFVLVEPEEKLNLSECLRKADEAMYLMKMKQHKEMGEW